jgi:hypothetical protein
MKSKGMRIAGGILALVASVGGTIGGFITVFFGAVGKVGSDFIQSGEAANQSVTIMTLGWLGILASFLALILGIVVLCSKSQTPAWILLVCSILGIVLGGTLVAFFMILAVLGAIFALVGGKKVSAAP